MALPGMVVDGPLLEWNGAAPAKFTDRFSGRPMHRRPVPTDARNGAHDSVAHLGFGGYFADPGGLVVREGIRHIPEKPSDVMGWRPCRRSLSAPGQEHYEKPEGRGKPEPPAGGGIFSLAQKRHIRQVSSKEEHSDLPSGVNIVMRENSLRAHDQPAMEVDVSAEMQRKSRVVNLRGQRNGIGCKTLGDKNYRHPDYMPKYFHDGNIIVGSGFVRGNFQKTEPRNSTSVQLVLNTDRPPVKSWKEKEREIEGREARAEVESLTRNWESGTLKECVKDYEEAVDSDEE